MDTQTGYARNGSVHLAFHVMGREGPLDLVFVPGFVGHHRKALESPPYRRFFEALSSFARVITFDRRGTGQSDRPTEMGTIEDQIDDLRAVMDAAGCDRAALMGVSEGGPLCMLFTATHPDRVTQLILYGTYARVREAPDYPIGWPDEVVERSLARVLDNWGTADSIKLLAPSWTDDAMKRWWGEFEREAASPGAIRSVLGVSIEIDVRNALPLIRVPTLVTVRDGDALTPSTQARYIADRIPGARFVETHGRDHIPFADGAEETLAVVREFITGERRAPEADRVLGTVLFTDIVGSTERAAALGDAAWRRVLEQHQDTIRKRLNDYRGREIKTTGDGFLAMFDGPTRAIRCAIDAARAVRELGIEIRAGLHTGECEIMGEDIGGIAVHIASRVAQIAGPGEVLVSRTVKDLAAGSDVRFHDRGTKTLRGVPDVWQVFAVEGAA